jgi:hypothetical protein
MTFKGDVKVDVEARHEPTGVGFAGKPPAAMVSPSTSRKVCV